MSVDRTLVTFTCPVPKHVTDDQINNAGNLHYFKVQKIEVKENFKLVTCEFERWAVNQCVHFGINIGMNAKNKS